MSSIARRYIVFVLSVAITSATLASRPSGDGKRRGGWRPSWLTLGNDSYEFDSLTFNSGGRFHDGKPEIIIGELLAQPPEG